MLSRSETGVSPPFSCGFLFWGTYMPSIAPAPLLANLWAQEPELSLGVAHLANGVVQLRIIGGAHTGIVHTVTLSRHQSHWLQIILAAINTAEEHLDGG